MSLIYITDGDEFEPVEILFRVDLGFPRDLEKYIVEFEEFRKTSQVDYGGYYSARDLAREFAVYLELRHIGMDITNRPRFDVSTYMPIEEEE